MIDYQNYTGDTQYNEIIAEALIAQQGLDADFFVRNQTKTEANDDQGKGHTKTREISNCDGSDL